MGAASSKPVLDPARALAPYSCASPVRSLPARHHTTTFRCSRRRNYLSYGRFDLRSGKYATGGRSRAPTSPATADVTAKHTRAALICHYPSVRRRRRRSHYCDSDYRDTTNIPTACLGVAARCRHRCAFEGSVAAAATTYSWHKD